jgi:TonB-dependent starch-binding outer membrane protein SusC
MKNKNGIKRAFRFLMLCFFFVAVSFGAYAQKTVTGKVIDEEGGALPGVAIVIKGTSTGTVTGMDGEFSLTNVKDDVTLVFTFVGMTPQEVLVGNQTTINVTMIAQTIGLEEVVAVGYGTQKKVNLTGSVAAITIDEKMTSRNLSNVASGLSGMLPGLSVSQNSGMAGKKRCYNVD